MSERAPLNPDLIVLDAEYAMLLGEDPAEGDSAEIVYAHGTALEIGFKGLTPWFQGSHPIEVVFMV